MSLFVGFGLLWIFQKSVLFQIKNTPAAGLISEPRHGLLLFYFIKLYYLIFFIPCLRSFADDGARHHREPAWRIALLPRRAPLRFMTVF